jgi:starch synthase
VRRLRVLFAAAECVPLAQAGGLGEVAAKLPRALATAGHDVRVLMPWYGFLDAAQQQIQPESPVRLRFGRELLWADVGRTELIGVPVYLVGHRVHTAEMYGGEADQYGWLHEHRRFRFFAAAAAALLRAWTWQPDVLHLNDYHTALIPTFVGVPRRPVVLTIHNARYQGSFGSLTTTPARLRDRDGTRLPPLSSPRARFVNFLRRGIQTADLVTAVSPTYARELMQPGHIDELAGILRRDRTVGILNGIDVAELDPRHDRALVRRYDASTLERRAANKRALQRRLGLPASARTPVLALVARIEPIKGIDLLLQLMVQLAERGVQVVISGNGGPRMLAVIEQMAAAAPTMLAYRRFDREEESLYYAGADITLVPSRYEPCGLVQLKAMRFGSVPIVQRVGGLADTVFDHHDGRGRGTGFVFDKDTPGALLAAIDRALAVYRRPREWRTLQRRGMANPTGWEEPAARYVAAYRRAIRLAGQ